MTPYKSLLVFAIVTTCIACPLRTRASEMALSFSGANNLIGASNATVGYTFSITAPVRVTDLGVWADSFNPGSSLMTSHAVTIWTSSGIPVAQATVPAGTSGTLLNNFRFVSLTTPVVLGQGYYVISAFFPSVQFSDSIVINATGITTGSRVEYGAYGSRSVSGDMFPSANSFNFLNSYFGPNFLYDTEGVAVLPELAPTWTLLLASITVLFGLKALARRTA